jgi:hypothetical protein
MTIDERVRATEKALGPWLDQMVMARPDNREAAQRILRTLAQEVARDQRVKCGDAIYELGQTQSTQVNLHSHVSTVKAHAAVMNAELE